MANMSVSAGSGYSALTKRIYRTVTGANSVDYRFVAEIAAAGRAAHARNFPRVSLRRERTKAAAHAATGRSVARLTTAKLNLGARLRLDNRAVTFANYTSLHDFETELLWLMNVGSV